MPLRIRKPSEKRASVNRKPTWSSRLVSRVELAEAGEERRPLERREHAARARAAPARRAGTTAPAGMIAIQNTARMSLANQAIRPIAASGASSAPTVSSACLRPNARPRISGGVSSATIASRGAAADALADAVGEARGHHRGRARREREQRLGQRGEAVAGHDPRLALQAAVGQPAGDQLGEIGGRLGDPVDRAERGRRQAEHDRDERRQQRVIDLARQVHQQADEAEHPDVAGKGRAGAHAAVIAAAR